MPTMKESERRNAWMAFMSSALCGLSAGENEIDDDEMAETAAKFADDALGEYEGRAIDGEFAKPFVEPEPKRGRRRKHEDEEEEEEND